MFINIFFMNYLAYLFYLFLIRSALNFLSGSIRLNLIYLLLFLGDVLICSSIGAVILIVVISNHKRLCWSMLLCIFQQSICITSWIILSLLFTLNIFYIYANFSITGVDVNLNDFIARIVVVVSFVLLIVLLVSVHSLCWIHFGVQKMKKSVMWESNSCWFCAIILLESIRLLLLLILFI